MRNIILSTLLASFSTTVFAGGHTVSVPASAIEANPKLKQKLKELEGLKFQLTTAKVARRGSLAEASGGIIFLGIKGGKAMGQIIDDWSEKPLLDGVSKKRMALYVGKVLVGFAIVAHGFYTYYVLEDKKNLLLHAVAQKEKEIRAEIAASSVIAE